jgi:Restriction alleviation protein Lar
MTEEKKETCPFCSSSRVCTSDRFNGLDSTYYAFIICADCEAQGPKTPSYDTPQAARTAAKEIWSRRRT